MNELDRLLEILFTERGEIFNKNQSMDEKEDLFRALCNVRPPEAVTEEFLDLQDRYLTAKRKELGIVRSEELEYKERIALWQGDITRLDADAIVNAGNSALLGCFQPLHNCIDNVIHSAAGIQVRLDCQDQMEGSHLPNGEVRVTEAYNLPGRHIFHTVGPIVHGGQVSEQNRLDLKKAYVNCLKEAAERDLKTIAFCCLSTGVYGYPQDQAAALAVQTVKEELKKYKDMKVIFNVYLDSDRSLYDRELS